jgi:hypothetical protein
MTGVVVSLTITLLGCGTPTPDGPANRAGAPDAVRFAGDPEAQWRDSKGKAVSDRVIDSYHGPEHCDTQTVVFIDMGWPPGTPAGAFDKRQYVRDPQAKLPSDYLPRTLDLNARLPADARFSGFSTEKMELWLSKADQGRAAYVVIGKVVERWPRATKPIYCA